MQIMLFDIEIGEWIFKRDESVRKTIKLISLTTDDGFKKLAPEVQLLYKSKSLREKDRLDFTNAVSKMNSAQKLWLKSNLIKTYENSHEWIARL